MKIGKFLGMSVLGIASYVGLTNKHIVRGIFSLEKPQGDIFAFVKNGSELFYLCKNIAHAEDLFKDWIAYHGWQEADKVGEGFFYINNNEETLLLNRETIIFDRYILWRTNRLIEN